MKEYARQCPICNHPITIKYRGVFKSELVLPEYCGNCGTRFLKVCPSCNKKLEDLTLYCTSCSHKLYDSTQETNNSSTRNSVNKPVNIERIMNQFLNDIGLIQQYYNEIYRLSLRTNDYYMGLLEFKKYTDSLNVNQSNETKVKILEAAISSVNYDDLINLINDNASGIKDYIQYYTHLFVKSLNLPATSYLCRYVNIPDAEELSETYTLKLRALYGKYTDALCELNSHDYLLREYFIRYKKIMSRKGFSDIAVGFVLGFTLGGTVGKLAYKTWNNLRNLSDSEFITSFYECVIDYMNMSFNINQSLLDDCEQVLKEVTEDFSNMYISIADAFMYAESNGVDILQTCRELLKPYSYDNCDFPINDDAMRMAGYALDELRQYGITIPQENRIIKLMGITL